MKKLAYFLLFITNGVFAQDLVISGITGPKTFSQYAAVSGSITIQNTGIIPTTRSTSVYAYLSSDNVLGEDDTIAGYATISPLNAHESTTVSMDTYGIHQSPGSYYLIIVVDQYSIISETDETNNVSILSGYTITAPNVDFRFIALTFDKNTVSKYDVLIPSFEVRNSGTTNVGDYVSTRFFLSQDQTLDENDKDMRGISLNFGAVLSDIVKEQGEAWNQLPIPKNTIPGVYYIIAKVDWENKYTETNELNNTIVSSSVTITENSNIDLEVTHSIYANYFTYGDEYNSLNINYELKNNGTTGVIGYRVDFYLSVNKNLPGQLLYSQPPSTHSSYYIGPGKTTTSSVNMNFGHYPFEEKPYPGIYYVIVIVNSDNAIPETNSSNNLGSSLTTVSIDLPPPPNLKFTAAAFQENYDNADTELLFSLDVLNNSVNPASQFYQQYTIKIKNALGQIVASRNYGEVYTLESQGTQTVNWGIFLEEPLAVGNYSVEITCQHDVCFTESYSFPLIISEAMYNLSGTIQGEDLVPITKGSLFLYQKTTSGIVRFINKIVPTTGTDFTFSIDTHPHTLYFIPDAVEFPDYVPTVYGKTVLLKDDSFITATEDVNVTFEILKLVAPAPGARAVSGSAHGSGGTTGRIKELVPVQNLPVILLNSSDQPVALVRTDDLGNYKFNNLPEGNYKLVLAFELDKTITQEPLPVDVTVNDAEVNFEINGTEIQSTVNVITGVDEFSGQQVKTFPNPFENRLFINNQKCYQTAEITDLTGAVLYSVSVTCGLNEWALETLPKGVYLLRLKESNRSVVSKIIKH